MPFHKRATSGGVTTPLEVSRPPLLWGPRIVACTFRTRRRAPAKVLGFRVKGLGFRVRVEGFIRVHAFHGFEANLELRSRARLILAQHSTLEVLQGAKGCGGLPKP